MLEGFMHVGTLLALATCFAGPVPPSTTARVEAEAVTVDPTSLPLDETCEATAVRSDDEKGGLVHDDADANADDTSMPLWDILEEYHRVYPHVHDAIAKHVVKAAPETLLDLIAKPLSLACSIGVVRDVLPTTCFEIERIAVRGHCRWSMRELQLTTTHEAYRRVMSDPGNDGLLPLCEANRLAVACKQGHCTYASLT
jgi:hypothetical protein